MKKSGLLGAVCACIFTLFCTSTNAALIEIDLLSANDAFITRDTTTGLDWLDVTLTVNRSVPDVLGGDGVDGRRVHAGDGPLRPPGLQGHELPAADR